MSMASITVDELKARAKDLDEHFGNGKPILFCVSYGFEVSWQIYSNLYSTPERAIERFNHLSDCAVCLKISPVLDIWNNPDQVDVI